MPKSPGGSHLALRSPCRLLRILSAFHDAQRALDLPCGRGSSLRLGTWMLTSTPRDAPAHGLSRRRRARTCNVREVSESPSPAETPHPCARRSGAKLGPRKPASAQDRVGPDLGGRSSSGSSVSLPEVSLQRSANEAERFSGSNEGDERAPPTPRRDQRHVLPAT